MIRPRFLPAAEAELLREVGYYSDARTGAGIRFQAAVAAAVELASRQPQGGVPGPHGTRSWRVKGFPFSVVGRAGTDTLLVVAIAHHRRKPGHWAARVA